MRRIYILLFVVVTTCISNAGILNTSGNIPLEDSYFTTASCDEKLKNLIISCHNFKTPFNKKDIHAEIEEEISDGIYRVRLFVYSNGENSTSSIGWIILDTKKNILKDISLDPESPVILKYNKDFYKDYLENCLEYRGYFYVFLRKSSILMINNKRPSEKYTFRRPLTLSKYNPTFVPSR